MEHASSVGLTPIDAYHFTIQELNTYLLHKNLRDTESAIIIAWRTINFLGGFFSGKLGPLERYLPETPKRVQEEEQKGEAMLEGLAKLGFKR